MDSGYYPNVDDSTNTAYPYMVAAPTNKELSIQKTFTGDSTIIASVGKIGTIYVTDDYENEYTIEALRGGAYAITISGQPNAQSDYGGYAGGYGAYGKQIRVTLG